MASYWEHPCKCLSCGLHFIVCSDYEKWPSEGTTAEMKKTKEEKILPHLFCPECGEVAPMGFSLKMLQFPPRETEGFIFNAVG